MTGFDCCDNLQDHVVKCWKRNIYASESKNAAVIARSILSELEFLNASEEDRHLRLCTLFGD